MGWIVEISRTAEKQISKLDRKAQIQIQRFLREKVQASAAPRSVGKPLHGEKAASGARTGDYRIICEIQEDRLVVLVVRVAHRKQAYR